MKNFKFFPHRTLAGVSALALFLGATTASLHAAVQTYTSAATFQNNLASGAVFETFNSFSGQNTTSPQAFNSGAFTFTLSDNSGGVFYSSGTGSQGSVFPSVGVAGESFTLTFGAGVTAVGGTFFLADINFSPLTGGSVAATLADGTTINLASTLNYGTEPFGGFASSTPITSLTLSSPASTANGSAAFVSLDNLYVGRAITVVPEPSTWAMIGFGMVGTGVVLRRRRAA